MSKKILIFGLFAAMLVSPVSVASVAQADTIYPYGGLTCSPVTQQSVNNGDLVSFSAYYNSYTGSVQNGQFTWTAAGGSPTYGTGSYFSTRFYTSNNNTVQVVTVSDGYQTSSCTVYMNGGYYPTPTPYPNQTLQCRPSYTNVDSGDRATWTASGGSDGNYFWSVSGPYNSGENTNSTNRSSSFSTRLYNDADYAIDRTVTVTNDGQTASCLVRVNPQQDSSSPVTMNHTVSNVNRSGQGSSVTAYNGDHLQFTTTIRTGRNGAQDVHIRDWLPSYLSYTPGSTRVNGSYTNDGIATGASTDSLALGNLSANRTTTVVFDATVNGAPNTVMTNSVNVHVRGQNDQNRTSTITVVGSYYPTPTPTYYPAPTLYPSVNGRVQLRALGRDVTRGQTGENTRVSAHSGDTLDLIIRIRSTDGSYLLNATVTDILPAGLTYILGSTTLNGAAMSDGITSSGINAGTLLPNTDTVVKFSVRVDGTYIPAVGTVVIRNTAQVRADGLGTMSATLPITIGTNLDITGIAGVQTGPADSLWLALIVAIMATGAYAMYTRTQVFGRRVMVAEVNRLARDSGMNFMK